MIAFLDSVRGASAWVFVEKHFLDRDMSVDAR